MGLILDNHHRLRGRGYCESPYARQKRAIRFHPDNAARCSGRFCRDVPAKRLDGIVLMRAQD
jgi:hypothetical protein